MGGRLIGHPLIREYFAEQLRSNHANAAKHAHERLFKHYLGLAQRTTINRGSADLRYREAITHACLAGRVAQAWGVYWSKFLNHNPAMDGRAHHVRQREAADRMLGVLREFFEKPWLTPKSDLSQTDQAILHGEVGHYLFILGRYEEAAPALEQALRFDENEADPKALCRAARYARLLRELHLVRGNFDRALEHSDQGVKLADSAAGHLKGGDDDESIKKNITIYRIVARAAHAQVLHYLGRSTEALGWFAEAEQMQGEFQKDTPLLFGHAGYWFVEFLTDCWHWVSSGTGSGATPPVGSATEWSSISHAVNLFLPEGASSLVMRSQYLVERAMGKDWPVDAALGKLIQGYAIVLGEKRGGEQWSHARRLADQAVEELRFMGQQHHLAHSLISRAHMLSMMDCGDEAKSNLEEATGIVERSSMKAYYAHILFCRAYSMRDTVELRRAQELTAALGYARLGLDLAMLAKQETEW